MRGGVEEKRRRGGSAGILDLGFVILDWETRRVPQVAVLRDLCCWICAKSTGLRVRRSVAANHAIQNHKSKIQNQKTSLVPTLKSPIQKRASSRKCALRAWAASSPAKHRRNGF